MKLRITNNQITMIKIERGILGINSSNELIVRSPMHVYKINSESLLEREFKSNEKVIGVVIDNKYSICEEWELNDGEKAFGYIVKNDLGKSTLQVQTIIGFNVANFDPFNAKYNLGEEVVVKKKPF